MKTIFALALLAAAAVDDPEISRLIGRLGSAEFAEREEATALLVARGRTALRALQTASRTAADAAVRSGASMLVKRIEHDLLTRPTLVTLDFRDQPLGEAIAELGKSNNFGLVGDLDLVRAALLRKITLHEVRQVPLMTALDRLCAAGEMRFGYGVDDPSAPPRFWLSNPLTFAPVGVLGPVSDSGSFRVKVLSVTYSLQRTGNLDREGAEDVERFEDERLNVWLQVMTEPRLMLKLNGEPRIIEAVDERGQSLIWPPQPEEKRMPSTDNPDPIFNVEVSLRPIQRRGATIKRFRGLIPVEVAELQPEPITVPLAGSLGKSFSGPDATLTIQALELDLTKNSRIELMVQSKFDELDVEPDKPAAPGEIPPVPDSIPFLGYHVMLQNEKGHKISWGAAATRIGPKEAKLSLSNSPFEEVKTIPAKLLFHGIIRITTEIPFEFVDISLP